MGCKVQGCDGDLWAAGFCSKHYNRLRTRGTTGDGPRARRPFAERLWSQIDKRGPDECWPWTAKSKTAGYGYIGIGGREAGKMLAHRAAWELTNGPIPSGEGFHGTVVMHKCDNRLCCNPAHLRIGSQYENVQDMDAKGRRQTVVKRGEEHHNARFTAEQIAYIRSSPKRTVELTREFGCGRATISHIRNMKSRLHG